MKEQMWKREGNRYNICIDVRSDLFTSHTFFTVTVIVTSRYTHTDIYGEKEREREREGNRVQQLRYGTKPNVK